MSKWDRVNTATLSGCCITLIHKRANLAAEGDILGCTQCGHWAIFRDGIWTINKTTQENIKWS